MATPAVGEILLQHESQKRAEDVVADGGICGVIYRPGEQHRLGPTEEAFDVEQIMVA